MRYLAALGLTLLVELPVYLLVLRQFLAWLPALRLGVVANLATHPLVWWILDRFGATGLAFVGCEVGAWLAETLLIAAVVRRDIAVVGLTALVANTASVGAGLILLS